MISKKTNSFTGKNFKFITGIVLYREVSLILGKGHIFWVCFFHIEAAVKHIQNFKLTAEMEYTQRLAQYALLHAYTCNLFEITNTFKKLEHFILFSWSTNETLLESTDISLGGTLGYCAIYSICGKSWRRWHSTNI